MTEASNSTEQRRPALDGVRVLDWTRLVPGAFAAALLGDLGADVIKIEEPQRGDYLRWIAPQGEATSCAFLALGRNRRSLGLDTRTVQGREVLNRLVEQADVLLESFRPGVLAAQGLGPEDLRARNPRLVVCSLSGFGANGPLQSKAAHDLNYQALGGSLDPYLWGGDRPRPTGVLVADLGGALYSVLSVLAALYARARDGEGQSVDLGLFDSLLSLTAMTAAKDLIQQQPYGVGEYRLSGLDPAYDVYPTADGQFVALGAVEPKFWEAFCQAVGEPELAAWRWEAEQRPALRERLTEVFRTRTRDEWAAFAEEGDYCLSAVLAAGEALDTQQVAERELLGEIDHPQEGRIRQFCFPAKLSATPAALHRPPPLLGEHTDEILAEAGFSREEIEAFRQDEVIR